MSFDFSQLLAETDESQFCAAGEVIFQMGDLARTMYVIRSGRAQILVGDVVLGNVDPGGIIGEMALLDSDVRSAAAVALSDCQVVAIDQERMLTLLSQHPSLGIEMAKVMVRRLRNTNFLVHHDALTQLPNRTLFQEKTRIAIKRAQRGASAFGVLFVKLDRLNAVNTSLGYAAGDVLLTEVAQRLGTLVHEPDTLARVGPDVFALLLEDISSAHKLIIVADQILELLAPRFVVSGQDIHLSANIGISCHPQDGVEEQGLLKNADAALQRAIEMGAGNYCFHSEELSAIALETLTLSNQLHLALERREFCLNYQPRVDFATGKITGVEALLRWRHTELGMIPPSKFIPIAEQSALIERIGEWVLNTACAQQKTWHEAGIPLPRMAVNLSARQLMQPDLAQRITEILKHNRLEAKFLEVEITESMLMKEPLKAVHILQSLRNAGVAVALDDFGTGYSSLGYLRQFPLDYMKIDQSFVRGLPGNKDDLAITKTVIALAKNLGLKVIAEGVETPEQLECLKQFLCEEYQGYFFSKPLPSEEMEGLLRSNLA